ncbi:MAG: (4Fe-4S)-binding protein [Melioribacteraceae bacterium]|nr:(4Fe-4S)-binding protein [Melioribacteraceae bacterium]MCF8263024.1 (4Fe-4S)-binding protein [Melioribacteraceae bacterium]MCF8430469.1 (4Fe-4S)-binding protein [Melioribacteraceae bacterium]
MERVLKYKNEDITVNWKPDVCIHAAECVKGSPTVFDPEKKPWINAANESSEKIMATIDKCPSGALSYSKNFQSDSSENESSEPRPGAEVKILVNGPAVISGSFVIFDSEGNEFPAKPRRSICRCGGSSNKPFCDGSHKTNGFTG